MPPLTKDDLASEIGLIISEAINARLRMLSIGTESHFELLHEEDIEDVAFEASDKAAELIERRLCTFNPAHDPDTCQLCK